MSSLKRHAQLLIISLGLSPVWTSLQDPIKISFYAFYYQCEVSWTAGQKKIILKQEEMIEFYKHLYAEAGGIRPPHPLRLTKNMPEMGKPAKCVQLSS